MLSFKKYLEKLKPHFGNIFWSNLNTMAVAVLGLASALIFARFTSKELYGQYLSVIAAFGLAAIISIPGVHTVILRTTAQGYEGVYRKGTTFSFRYSLLGIPLLLIAGALIYLFKGKAQGAGVLVCAVLFPFTMSLQTWVMFLKGRSEFKKLSIYNSIKLFVHLVAVVAAILFSGNLIVILLAHFLVNIFFNSLYHLWSLKSLRNEKLDEGWKKQSYALTIMSLSVRIFGQLDIFLLAAFLPLDQIGQVAVYGVVMRVVEVFFLIIKSTVEAILPKVFKSEGLTIKYFYKFFLLSFLIPVILYPLVKYPVLMFGQKYSEVVGYSQVYLFAIPFYFMSYIANNFLIKYQMNKEINISRIISIITVIILYAVLIPLYGIWGGVVSSMLYYLIQAAITWFLLYDKSRKEQT